MPPGDHAWTDLMEKRHPHVAEMSHPFEASSDLQPNLWKSAKTGPINRAALPNKDLEEIIVVGLSS